MVENKEQRKLVTKKRVTIRCGRPFRIGFTPFSGYCPNIVLTIEDIAKIIERKNIVLENFTDGTTLALDFNNYNTYNGPTDVTDDTPALTEINGYKPKYIKKFDADGNEIFEKPKLRFGGGFRKDPRTTGQIPGFHAAYTATPFITDDLVVDDSNITFESENNIDPDHMYSKKDNEKKTDSQTIIIENDNNEKKNNDIKKESSVNKDLDINLTVSDKVSNTEMKTLEILNTTESKAENTNGSTIIKANSSATDNTILTNGTTKIDKVAENASITADAKISVVSDKVVNNDSVSITTENVSIATDTKNSITNDINKKYNNYNNTQNYPKKKK